MKSHIFAFSIIAAVAPHFAQAKCLPLNPFQFGHPIYYTCTGKVIHSSNELAEGMILSEKEARKDAAPLFSNPNNCQEIDVDHSRRFFSFCDPDGCDQFTTTIMIKCRAPVLPH